MPLYIKTFYESCRSKAHQVPNCWNTFKVILFHQKWNSVTNLCWNFSRRQHLRAIFFQVCKPNVIFRSPIWMSSCILEGSRCFPRKGFEWCHWIFPRRYPESVETRHRIVLLEATKIFGTTDLTTRFLFGSGYWMTLFLIFTLILKGMISIWRYYWIGWEIMEKKINHEVSWNVLGCLLNGFC